jgi:hypothetical protein
MVFAIFVRCLKGEETVVDIRKPPIIDAIIPIIDTVKIELRNSLNSSTIEELSWRITTVQPNPSNVLYPVDFA